MAVLCEDLRYFMEAVDSLVDYTMVYDVGPRAVRVLQEKIESEVYQKYTPKGYERKREDHGLIDPREIDVRYESPLKTLHVQSVRDDWEPTMRKHEGRNVADVVESGDGYDWASVKPRPFHKPAEIEMVKEADKILNTAMDVNLSNWEW